MQNDMKLPDTMAPPVRAKLYEHQIMAYLFVLGVFDAQDKETLNQGGDANERFHG